MTNVDPSEIDQIKNMIREAGIRATPARIATLRLLQSASSPMTHADAATALEEFGFDKATVFRNLNDLATAGILNRTELGDHVWRFELIQHGKSKHPHFICVDCGNVSCLSEVKLTTQSQQKSQEVGEVTEILLRGHCNDCGT